MILILCALLACCVTTPTATKCDGHRCDFECAPVSMSWCEFLERGLDTLWYSDYHNGDSVRVWVDHTPGRGCAPADSGYWEVSLFGTDSITPGLWEYRCEVDTSYVTVTFGSHVDDRVDHLVVWGDPLDGHTLYRRTIDTTCVWQRAQEYEYFDTYCMDGDFRMLMGEEWDWHQPCINDVTLYRKVK